MLAMLPVNVLAALENESVPEGLSASKFVSVALPRHAGQLALPAQTLAAGDYTLVVSSGIGPGDDHDDFLVGTVLVSGAGALTGGAAVLAN